MSLSKQETLPSHPEYFIQGITRSGTVFRPRDWAERLCGVVATLVAGPGRVRADARLNYCNFARPMIMGELKCVVLSEGLRRVAPSAFDFVMRFAKDNNLQVSEGCSLPEDSVQEPHASEKPG